MQGLQRKICHATLYELVAIVLFTDLMKLVPRSTTAHAAGLAVTCSALAVCWNMAFNWAFERWERRQPSRARTLPRRMTHAVGFEGGLVILTVPAIAWWMGIGWVQALLMDVGLMVFFLIYTFCFNWVFDHVFGVPDSARSGRS